MRREGNKVETAKKKSASYFKIFFNWEIPKKIIIKAKEFHYFLSHEKGMSRTVCWQVFLNLERFMQMGKWGIQVWNKMDRKNGSSSHLSSTKQLLHRFSFHSSPFPPYTSYLGLIIIPWKSQGFWDGLWRSPCLLLFLFPMSTFYFVSVNILLLS